jgi:hypothetical protein
VAQDRVNSDPSVPTETDRRVVPFRPRGGVHPARGWWQWNSKQPQPVHSHVEGLAKYERTDTEDEYRHRMLVNAAALIFTLALVAAGVWVVSKMAEIRQNQDCYLAGYRNCTPIKVLPAGRDGRQAVAPHVSD